ncbi:protein arginine N-methyltransferase 7 [Drosophila tropicalis]|uniref:protein arginine N-methyltransferase 7 n=1 Tax=Drosophila tropicalis TaxID=46794 RepID=UPI0035AC1647
MSSFSQVRNPITGQATWQENADDYDYHQEVANAGFGDMLHDWERNQKYYAAIKKTIKRMQADGQEVHVLDIGTGTGILSMMALKAGADSVTACEAFLPMANCAAKIMSANGADKIQLIRKRSTEIQIGVDMARRANLLVAELLDTELIGEGAIGIYNHAHQELLTKDALCIPARARCYAQVATSSLAKQWNGFKLMANLDGETLLRVPSQLNECKGDAALHDLQLSQLPTESFHLFSKSVEIFEFDFQQHLEPIQKQRNKVVPLQASQPGSADMVFYWWDIDLDHESEIVLSCAPFWAHPDKDKHVAGEDKPLANSIPWRDHWMQAIYYIPKPLHLSNTKETFYLSCHHDEYSLWFDAQLKEPAESIERHHCTCDLHLINPRSRIGQLNQSLRNKRYLNYLEETTTKDSQFLVLGNSCFLGLATSGLGAASVEIYDSNSLSRRLLDSFIKFNKLENVRLLEKLEEVQDHSKLTHIFAEPYFINSILPWDNFYFGTLLLRLKDRLSEGTQISPCAARIFALPMEFLDLHKIRAPVGNCEGFDLSLFDEMVKASADKAVSSVEAQPLWEYPGRALAQPQEILRVDFANFNQELHQQGCIELVRSKECNGIALWVDWQLYPSESPKAFVSSGPSQPIEIGKFVKWDMFVRQGVHFPQSRTINASRVEWQIDFKPLLGELNFQFDLKSI